MIGDGGHDAVDILAVEQFLIAASSGQAGVTRDLLGERVAPIIQISSRYTLDSRNRDGASQQARALHPDADHAETDPVTRGHRPRCAYEGIRVEQHRRRK